jgi:hypothetical protein
MNLLKLPINIEDAPEDEEIESCIFTDLEGDKSDSDTESEAGISSDEVPVSGPDTDESSEDSLSGDEIEQDVFAPGKICWAPFGPRQRFPAKVVAIQNLPSHLKEKFRDICNDQCLVEWIGESSFSKVKKARLIHLGRNEIDKKFVGDKDDRIHKYHLALDMMNVSLF